MKGITSLILAATLRGTAAPMDPRRVARPCETRGAVLQDGDSGESMQLLEDAPGDHDALPSWGMREIREEAKREGRQFGEGLAKLGLRPGAFDKALSCDPQKKGGAGFGLSQEEFRGSSRARRRS